MSRDADLASGEREKRQESVPELVKDLTRDISELVRQEIELARVEMTEKGKQAGLGFGMFGGAALLGMAVVGGSMATVIILLDLADATVARKPGHDRSVRRGRCAAGAAWSRRVEGNRRSHPGAHQAVRQGGHPVGEDARAIEGQIEDTRERMGDTVAALSYKADVPGRMKDSVSEKKDAVTGKLSSTKEALMGSAGDAASGAQDGSRRVIGIAQENPLGLAIGAAAAGFVVGSLLPGTRVEEERIGPAASQVREQVTEVASDAVEHGKQVAQDAAQAAADTAKQSGQEHADQLRESARETMTTDS